MTESKSPWFRKSSTDVDDEFLPIEQKRKSHRAIIPKKAQKDARDDSCSLSSLEESVGKESVFDDDSTTEGKQVDEEEMFVPVVKLVDSLNKWIFNENDNQSVNDGSCTSNDDDSLESGSCTSSQGQSSCCSSSVDNSSIGSSLASSVEYSNKYISTIQKELDKNKLGGRNVPLDEASLSSSITESLWSAESSKSRSLAEANRRTMRDLDRGLDQYRHESSALGSYISDNEDNDDTLWADVETMHLRDQTQESACVGYDTATTIRNILKDFRESSCMEPATTGEVPRYERSAVAKSTRNASPPKSQVDSSSIPESITTKRKTVNSSPTKTNGDTMQQLDGFKGQQKLETRRKPNFSSSRSGQPRSAVSAAVAVRLVSHHRPDHQESLLDQEMSKVTREPTTPVGNSGSIQDQGVVCHAVEQVAPAASELQDAIANNKKETNADDVGKHSKTKRIVASLRRAQHALKGKRASISRKIKHKLGREKNRVNLEKSNLLPAATTTKSDDLEALDSQDNGVTTTDSFELFNHSKRKHYSCLGDRFLFLISGCAPTQLEQVQPSPSIVTDFGPVPIADSRSFEVSLHHQPKSTIPMEEDPSEESQQEATKSPRGYKKSQKLVANLTRRLQQVPHRWGTIKNNNNNRGASGEPEQEEEVASTKDTTPHSVEPTTTTTNTTTIPQRLASTHQAAVQEEEEEEEPEALEYNEGRDGNGEGGCIEKSLEEYHHDTSNALASRWRPFDGWNGLVVFSRKPSGALTVSSEERDKVMDHHMQEEEEVDIEMGLGGHARNDWGLGEEPSKSDLECPQGIEAVLDTRPWKHLERSRNHVQLISSDESGMTAAKERKGKIGRNIPTTLRRWSKRLVQDGQKYQSGRGGGAGLRTVHNATTTNNINNNNKVGGRQTSSSWEGLVAVNGKPHVLMIQSHNYNHPRDLSATSRMALHNARCHLRGL